jgi:hypothetical protein
MNLYKYKYSMYLFHDMRPHCLLEYLSVDCLDLTCIFCCIEILLYIV